MDNKGINGNGLAHLWDKANSVFATKKDVHDIPAYVTEVVYPLSSKENYTGVEVSSASTLETYTKVSDKLYTKQDLQSKKIIRYNADGTILSEINISNVVDISENGSFRIAIDCFVIQPEDVGKTIDWDEDSVVFFESGTYLWKKTNNSFYCELDIAGTYKREVEPQDIDLLVRGEIDPETFQVTRIFDNNFNAIDHGKIQEAIRIGKSVRLVLRFPLDPDWENVIEIPFNVETATRVSDLDIDNAIQFGAIADFALGDGNGKQLYHFKVTLSEDNSITTEYILLGNSSGGQEIDTEEILWVECEFNFGTGQAENFSRDYEEIVQAFNEGKTIKFAAKYSPNGKSYEYALGDLIHYREGERELEFAVFVYANILTQEASLHHFRITLNDENETHTYIELLSGGEGGGGSQEAVSPTVSIEPISGGHRVIITDVNGTDSFDVMNGAKGDKGDKGDAFTYEDFTPEQLASLKGAKGDDFTYEDFTPAQLEALKSDIVEDVLDALPERIGTWQGGSY